MKRVVIAKHFKARFLDLCNTFLPRNRLARIWNYIVKIYNNQNICEYKILFLNNISIRTTIVLLLQNTVIILFIGTVDI